MNNIRLLTAAGTKNVFRNKTAVAILVPTLLILVIGVALLLCLLLIAPEAKSAAPDRALLASHLGMVLYTTSLISIGVTLNSLVFQTMIREKSRGNLETLLATPLKVSEVWIGKSLALFVPGLLLGILLTLLAWVVVNAVYFLPQIGWIVTPQMMVNSLVAVPLMYLFFGMLVHQVGFITKPATGNIIAQVFLPVMANLAIQLVAQGALSANSWQFLVLNFGIAAVIGGLVLALRPRVTAEKVILSG